MENVTLAAMEEEEEETPFSSLRELLSPPAYLSLGIFLLVMALLGTSANALVLHLFRSDPRCQSLTTAYLEALATSDMLMAAVGLSSAAVSTMAGRWVFGDAGCVAHGLLVCFLGLFNLSLLTVISADRYVAILKPHMRARMSKRWPRAMIGVCCGLTLTWALLPLFGWSRYVPEGLGTSCSLDWASRRLADQVYVVVIFLVFFAIPVIVIITSYTSIYLYVQKVSRENLSFGDQRCAKIERRLAFTYFLIFGTFLLSWTPYAVLSLLAIIGYKPAMNPFIASLPALLAKMAPVWNPITYVATNRQFQQFFAENYLSRWVPARRSSRQSNDEEMAGVPSRRVSCSVLSPARSVRSIRILPSPETPPGVSYRNHGYPHDCPSPARKEGNLVEQEDKELYVLRTLRRANNREKQEGQEGLDDSSLHRPHPCRRNGEENRPEMETHNINLGGTGQVIHVKECAEEDCVDTTQSTPSQSE